MCQPLNHQPPKPPASHRAHITDLSLSSEAQGKGWMNDMRNSGDGTRTVVITGASDGIGAAAARKLADTDTRLVLVGRSLDKTRAVAEEVGAEYRVADFERLDEVRRLAAALLRTLDRIDVLANNAGGMFDGPTITVDEFERTFQVNHLAPYLLTNLLLERLLASRATVVNTSSVAAKLFARPNLDDLEGLARFRPLTAYGNAKLANVLFTKGLHERFNARGLSAVAFHPGKVATQFAAGTTHMMHVLYHSAAKRFLLPVETGGARLAHFIEGRTGELWESGEYYGTKLTKERSHAVADDPEFVRRHWEMSGQMLGVRWDTADTDQPAAA